MTAKQDLSAESVGKEAPGPALRTVAYLLIGVLVGVPLAHSSFFLHSYSVPKFDILLIACVLLAGALVYLYADGHFALSGIWPFAPAVLAYVGALTISTALGVSPIISTQGSFPALTGLSTHVCFAVLAVGAWVAAGYDLANFKLILRAITIAGMLVSLIGVGQFVGIIEIDPGAEAAFGDPSRIYATLGHPDFAGNFFLYIVFASEATALLSRSSKWQIVGGGTSLISFIALVFTGTRGAWVGLLTGILVGIVIAVRQGVIRVPSRKAGVRATLGAALLLVVVALGIRYTSLGAPIRSRIAGTVQEGFTGSGRTTDWKLALRMLRKYWVSGCGPDAFRLAQLPFKTDEYARATSGVDAEDPHSAYLSSLVSTGLLGFFLYLALIYYAIHCYWRAIRDATEHDQRAAGIVLLSGMIAVLVHDVFLHHMVSTGAYFFVFLGLGPAWAGLQEVAARRDVLDRPRLGPESGSGIVKMGDETGSSKLEERVGSQSGSPSPGVVRAVILAATAVLFIAAVGYSYRILKAEYNIVKCLSAGSAGDSASTIAYGVRATSVSLYQTDFNFCYAGALESVSASQPRPSSDRLLELAVAEMSHATVRTLSPVPNFVALALLRIEIGDLDGADWAIQQAEQSDQHSYLPHMARSTLYLKQGELEGAIDEFKTAKSLGAPQANIQRLHGDIGVAVRRADSSELWHKLTGKFFKHRDKPPKPIKTQTRAQ